MTYLNWRPLTVLCLGAGALVWVAAMLAERAGISPVHIPWTVAGVCIVVGIVTLWMAWAVRQYLAGKRPGLDPLRAARTVVLAQAAAYTGAMLGGAFLGYAIALAANWSHQPRRELAIAAAIAALGAFVLLACGVVAERWCRIDPPTRDAAATPGGTLAA